MACEEFNGYQATLMPAAGLRGPGAVAGRVAASDGCRRAAAPHPIRSPLILDPESCPLIPGLVCRGANVAIHIASALQYLQSHNIVHLDVK